MKEIMIQIFVASASCPQDGQQIIKLRVCMQIYVSDKPPDSASPQGIFMNVDPWKRPKRIFALYHSRRVLRVSNVARRHYGRKTLSRP